MNARQKKTILKRAGVPKPPAARITPRKHRKPQLPQDVMEYPKRFLTRAAVSIPARLEETAANFLDVEGTLEDAAEAAREVKQSYDEGRLMEDAKKAFESHMNSPEAAADFIVDLLATLATRNPKFLDTNVDEYAIAGLAAKNLPGQEKRVPYVPGEALQAALDRLDARDKARMEEKYGRPSGRSESPWDKGASHGAPFKAGGGGKKPLPAGGAKSLLTQRRK